MSRRGGPWSGERTRRGRRAINRSEALVAIRYNHARSELLPREAGKAAPGLAVSAALFGASYMIAAALRVVWSARVFEERPATGFTAAILTGSVGSIAGPAAAGLLAAHIGLASTFMTLAAITVAAVSIRPAAVDRRAGASPAAHSAVR